MKFSREKLKRYIAWVVRQQVRDYMTLDIIEGSLAAHFNELLETTQESVDDKLNEIVHDNRERMVGFTNELSRQTLRDFDKDAHTSKVGELQDSLSRLDQDVRSKLREHEQALSNIGPRVFDELTDTISKHDEMLTNIFSKLDSGNPILFANLEQKIRGLEHNFEELHGMFRNLQYYDTEVDKLKTQVKKLKKLVKPIAEAMEPIAIATQALNKLQESDDDE